MPENVGENRHILQRQFEIFPKFRDGRRRMGSTFDWMARVPISEPIAQRERAPFKGAVIEFSSPSAGEVREQRTRKIFGWCLRFKLTGLERQFSSAEPTHKKKPPWPYEGSVPLGQAQEHLLLSLNAQPPNAARRERFLVAIDGAKLNFTEKRLQFWYLWACR
jgi:hypothetical protein